MNCPHEELLALPEAVRRRADAESNWRIMGYHSFEQVAAQIFALDRTRTLCSAVFDMPAVPLYSLLFAKGSQQTVHQDTSAFHVWPKNYLIGVWIACEDIRPESGPLEYYPGSHREPLFDAFDNYPQTQRRTASREDVARYDAHVLEIAQRYPRKLFTPRRGAALFWHGMLLHGGSPVTDQAATRKSFVIHYMAEGTNREAEIVGPFNW
jgi:ectoine hydroxylase-related dioxygenase (phytanoyl-CoA dioxygenase family)